MTKAEKAAQFFKTLKPRLLAAVKVAENRSLLAARYELEQASRGTLTERDLRRLDHPYARRHGKALRDAAILNQRTGKTARGWRIARVKVTSQGTQGRVYNRSEASRWIREAGRGRGKMLPRPVTARVLARIKDERNQRLRRAIRSVLKEF